MMRARPHSQKGTVLLVALCFVAVLGISLAGYIAVCSRTMQLSNRTYQTGLSAQLAEMGLEEALRAFNKNDWSDWTNGTAADWTVSGTTASCTITFPAGKFGQGATGSVKIRVDNYNANQLNSAWNSSTTYRVNDTVGHGGAWYRCVRANSNQTPSSITNMGYWVPDPMPAPLWDSTVAYAAEDVVYYTSTNTWYRCILAPTANQAPSNGTYWTSISKISLDAGYSSIHREVLFYYGTWYYFDSGSSPYWFATPNPPNSYAPVVAWCWRQGYAYAFNDLVFYGNPGVWYRCKTAHTSSGSILPTNTTYWENALTGMWGWNSSLSYNLGDVVYSGSSWYRCILANTNKAPASYPANWSANPNLPRDWNSGRQYSQNDTVRYNGVWYLSLQNSNTGQNPVTATTYWIGANTSTASYQWNATTAYSVGNYRCYGGVWYWCTTANTGQSPNNTSYWTASWAQGSGVTTGAPVVYAEGTVNIANSPSVKTQLRATLAPAPLFPNAVASTTTISANSGGTVDSYDSNTGTYASQTSSATTNHSAVVAALSTITVSSPAIKGYVAMPSPPAGIGGTVKSYTSPASPSIDPTRVSRSPYIPQFDPIPIGGLATNWSTTPKGTALDLATTINIGTPGATTPSRYHYNGTLTIGNATVTNLRINGPVILYVNGDLLITASGSTGRINISSTGSAEIHVAGEFQADAGGEGIVNSTLDPKKLIIISDTTSTADHFYSEGVNPLYGVVYVPYTTSVNGYYNNNNATNIYGAISARKITYSGANLNVHYDTQLRYATFGGVDQPYTITEWRELTDPAERVVLP